MSEKLQALTVAAVNLNNAPDELDAEITRVEEGIRQSGIRLELWQVSSQSDMLVAHAHEIVPGVARGVRESDQVKDGVTHVRPYSEIGFTQIDADWRLAVRRMQNLTGPELDFDREIGEPVPLVSAPLHVRMEAAQHLERFVGQLTRHAEYLSAGARSTMRLASF